MPLSISLLGPLRIERDGKAIAESRTKKIEALLVYLALESQRPHRRETLVGMLFPEMSDDAARTNLRQTFTRLRRAIQDKKADPSYLIVTRESAQFNTESDHTLDVVQFEHLLRGCDVHRERLNERCADCMAQVQAALTLYRGPFLDNFYLQDSVEFDEWVLVLRERWQQTAVHAMQTLASYHERRGEYSAAVRTVRRRLEVEPWNEAAQRQLMRLLAFQGKRNDALASYKAFQAQLMEELGVDPAPQTVALRDEIATMADERPYNLPARNPLFIGREEELAHLQERLVLPESRLLSLVGSGGIGKTQLAVEIGWQVTQNYLGPFPHGVYLVPLAFLAEADGTPQSLQSSLATAVADAIGFALSGSADPQTQLLRYLRHKSMLIILDNVEQIVDAGRDFIHAILTASSNVKLIVTTRERLNLTQEWVLLVDGLPFPPLDTTPQEMMAQEMTQYGAVQLFLRRAQQTDAQFGMFEETDTNNRCTPTAVARICALLHGMPLAIELATAWVRVLTCDEISQEIEQNLDALTVPMHGLPPRHRSIRAVFTYSWELLTAVEKQTVAHLSIFRDGFDREAATTVADASLSALSTLIDKSLLRRTQSPTRGARYRMLDVLRQYAQEKLDETAAATVRARHSDYYLAFVAARGAAIRGSEQQTALQEMRQELENIRVAWEHALAQQNLSAIDDAVDTLALFYYMRSWFAEGSALFSTAATQVAPLAPNSEVAQRVHSKLLARHGWFTFLLGNPVQAEALLAHSREQLRPLGDSIDLAYALIFSAVVRYNGGDYEQGQALAEEGLALSEALQDTYHIAIANNVLSQIAYSRGNYAAAKAHSETSLALEQALGNRWSMAFSFTNLGLVAYAMGAYEEAQAHHSASLEIREALRDARGKAICLNHLGDTARATGALTEAAAQYRAALALFREIGNQTGTIISLNRLGSVLLAQGEHEAAHAHLRDALRRAQATEATPQMLATLVNLAALLQKREGAVALALAAHVQQHPSATREAQTEAAALHESLTVAGITTDARPLPELITVLLN